MVRVAAGLYFGLLLHWLLCRTHPRRLAGRQIRSQVGLGHLNAVLCLVHYLHSTYSRNLPREGPDSCAHSDGSRTRIDFSGSYRTTLPVGAPEGALDIGRLLLQRSQRWHRGKQPGLWLHDPLPSLGDVPHSVWHSDNVLDDRVCQYLCTYSYSSFRPNGL